MSGENKRKCFTFTWTLENIDYCWQRRFEDIESPNFVVNELQEFKYYLQLYPKGLGSETHLDCILHRTGNGPDVNIDCEFALLAKDGSVLTSRTYEDVCDWAGTYRFKQIREVFDTKRSIYLPDDKLTVRCRIWKSEGGLTENVQCFARTRICIEKNSFLWKIKNFSNIRSDQKCTYQIKSMLDNELLLTFEFLPKNTYTGEDCMALQLVAENGGIKHFKFCVTLLNDVGSAIKSMREEFLFCENKTTKLCSLPFSENDLNPPKNLFDPNDDLTLRCDCTFSTGKMFEDIESISNECDPFHVSNLDNRCLYERNMDIVSKHVLDENLKSLFHDNILTDIRLKTNTEIYFAHKNILSARSPVFKAMFEKEKLKECVDIEDLDSDTVYRMLEYIYTAEIEDLQWENACNLYGAADKYEILSLRHDCSAFLKSNLCPNNACEVLILADFHKDEELKAAAQVFICNHEVLNSEEWKQLTKSHVKLAADTMDVQTQLKIKNEILQKMEHVKMELGALILEKLNAMKTSTSNEEEDNTHTEIKLPMPK